MKQSARDGLKPVVPEGNKPMQHHEAHALGVKLEMVMARRHHVEPLRPRPHV